ncbi:MAG TPA: GAF domain-containing protein [Pyrinomonadaceae bacterium]
MRPDTLQHYDEIRDATAPPTPAPSDASAEQLEALAALAAATADSREVERLLEGLADTITRLTDYRTCMVALFTDEPPYHPRVLSYSRNIPPEYAERVAAGSYPREQVMRLVEESVRIEVGQLGFAAYFPPSHYDLQGSIFADRYKAEVERAVPADPTAARWSESDELFVPLSTRGGEFLGVISLDDPRSGAAPERRSVLPVVAFARQAAQLIERQRDADALAQQVEREALVNRITRAVRRSLEPEEVFRAAVEEMGVHLSADRCTLYMLDREAGVARNVAEFDAHGVEPAGGTFLVAPMRLLTERIIRHGVVTFDDVTADPSIRPVYEAILKRAGTRSIMYAAVTVGEEVHGAFAISTLRERHWRESDVALARAVADQTGIAIRQAELYQRAEATSAREALINRLSKAVRASLDLPEVLHAATHELGAALRASRVYLRPYDPAREEATPVEHEYLAPGVASIGNSRISYLNPIGQFLIRNLRPLVIDDAEHPPAESPDLATQVRDHAARYGVSSMIFCPLIVQGDFRGALCIHQTGGARHWGRDDVALVEAVAAQLAVGIAQAELFEMVARGKQTWEATFDAMSDGVFIFDAGRQLVRVNRAGAEMESAPPRELLGRRCCDILRSGESHGCLVERVMTERRGLTLEYTPERLARPLLVTAEPLRLSGREIGSVCTVRDLTELRQFERLARERQTLLEHVLESARESICALDPEGRFMWCNSGATAMLGYAQDDLIGRHFSEVMDPADEELARERFALALGGQPQTTEARIVTRDGHVRYSVSDTTPLVIDGRTTGVLSISRDVTEKRQERERAAQADKLRALGQLASGVAHDFNNALAAIMGRAELLRRSAFDPAAARGLDVILTAAEDAAATVRRIRAFARQAPGEEMATVDVAELLRDSVEITRTRWENEARARGLSYDVRLEACEECAASGNASELREVFVNLIVNALDAMSTGGRLTVGCRPEGEWVRVLFTDTGAGMTEEVRARVFEPFYTTKGAHGTGLGLFVSYGIIERHRGQIAVESDEGRGSTFAIMLPRVADAVVVAAPQRGPARVAGVLPLRVLVVDDEEVVRETLADMIGVLGHYATPAASGREALDLLDGAEFDVIFSDLSMPGMDGWELAREVRRRRHRARICIVTGYGKDTAPPDADGEQSPADAVIGKPFNFEQVEETLARFKD